MGRRKKLKCEVSNELMKMASLSQLRKLYQCSSHPFTRRCLRSVAKVRFGVVFRRVRGADNEPRKTTYAYRNWVLELAGFDSYDEYLGSRLWKRIRARVYLVKGSLCSYCGGKANQIHHEDYTEENLKGKSLDHLYPACSLCHNKCHYSKHLHLVKSRSQNMRSDFHKVRNAKTKKKRRVHPRKRS